MPPAAPYTVIMYADVVGSTQLYESIGNVKAHAIITGCLASLRKIAEAHAGVVLAELGDEIMCRFEDAGDVAAAACQMHATMSEEYPRDDVVPPMTLRIGAHLGVVETDGEFLSETARIAHWATGNAKPEQTLATAALMSALPRIYRAVSRFVDDETWNFVSVEHMALHEIIWDVEAVTACGAEPPPAGVRTYTRVTFRYGGNTVVVDEQRPVISIGRERENDLVVNQELISRQHISAQFSRGRCTVTDTSTNGTMLIPRGGNRQVFKRETLSLRDEGILVMGHPPEIEEKYCVYYACG